MRATMILMPDTPPFAFAWEISYTRLRMWYVSYLFFLTPACQGLRWKQYDTPSAATELARGESDTPTPIPPG